MKVKLISSIQDELPAHLAAAICVGKESEILKNYGIDYNGLNTAIASGHYSVLEHLPITWYIADVSRALTHQLVRHRIASYSQQSQRYNKIDTNAIWYIIPNSIKDIPDALESYNKIMSDIAYTYHLMLEKGIPKEDARFVLPNACKSKILVSMNARAFIEAARLRLCNKAQWEIHTMFQLMRNAIKEKYPKIYELAVPNCKTIGCREVQPCGISVDI